MTFTPLSMAQLEGDRRCCGDQRVEFVALSASAVDRVYAIERQAHSHPWSLTMLQECLASRQHCLVVMLGEQIAGYAVVCSAAGSAELLNIAVAPQWQRSGIASALLQHLLERLPLSSDTIYLEVRQSNHGAIALYEGMGFSEVGVRPNYYPAAQGYEDALIYAYHLG